MSQTLDDWILAQCGNLVQEINMAFNSNQKSNVIPFNPYLQIGSQIPIRRANNYGVAEAVQIDAFPDPPAVDGALFRGVIWSMGIEAAGAVLIFGIWQLFHSLHP
jgi:hypothetical protein